jgi:6-phosphogluconolactonase
MRQLMNATRVAIACAAALFAAVLTGAGTAAASPEPDLSHGALFTETNSADGNAVAVYPKAADGSPTSLSFTVPTGGLGTGSGLGSQGSVVLSHDGSQLFAVNAGSDTISSFAVGSDTLTLQNVVSSGGSNPISLTAHDHTLYVLNAGATAGISGFSIDRRTGLTPLPGSSQPLSAGAAGPEQVSFSPDGRVLVVAEKGSNSIDTFQVAADGLAGAAQSSPSVGAGPYGFDFDNHGDVIVSDAASNAASSYALSKTGALTLVSGPVSTNGQAAPCWLVVSNDGRFAYTANAGSGTISGFAVDNGRLTLLVPSGISADLGSGSHPLDEAVGTRGGHYLYILADGLHSLQTYRIDDSGNLTFVTAIPGLPTGDTGLADG